MIQIQIQADSFVSDTNWFINFWLRSMATRGERHNSLKPMLTILCWTRPNARRILWCLRSQFISAGRDPKNSTARLNGWKLNCSFQQSNTQLLSFQNSQILRTIFSGHEVIHTPALFPVWGLLWQMVIVISFAHGRKTVPSDYAPGLRDPSGSKPFQTEW